MAQYSTRRFHIVSAYYAARGQLPKSSFHETESRWMAKASEQTEKEDGVSSAKQFLQITKSSTERANKCAQFIRGANLDRRIECH